jgi:hypothetical protein
MVGDVPACGEGRALRRKESGSDRMGAFLSTRAVTIRYGVAGSEGDASCRNVERLLFELARVGQGA